MAVTIKEGKEQAISIDEISMLINAQTRYVPQGDEIKIVTCDESELQRVHWVSLAEYQALQLYLQAERTVQEIQFSIEKAQKSRNEELVEMLQGVLCSAVKQRDKVLQTYIP